MNVAVITGAEALHPRAVAAISSNATVVAADGALDHALRAGLQPAVLVGDLDSVTDDGLAWATANATIERHDPDKDQTDTELALAVAANLNPDRLILVAGGGDRLDHTLAVIGALGHRSLTSVPTVEAWWGEQHFRVLHGPGRAVFDELSVGQTISVLAAHGECQGVTITGVKWPLDHYDLAPLSGLGVSNVVTDPPVTITVIRGVLTITLNPA